MDCSTMPLRYVPSIERRNEMDCPNLCGIIHKEKRGNPLWHQEVIEQRQKQETETY